MITQWINIRTSNGNFLLSYLLNRPFKSVRGYEDKMVQFSWHSKIKYQFSKLSFKFEKPV